MNSLKIKWGRKMRLKFVRLSGLGLVCRNLYSQLHPTACLCPRSSTFLAVSNQQDTTEPALAQGAHFLVQLFHLCSDQGLGTQSHHVFQGQSSLLTLLQLLYREASQAFITSILHSCHFHWPVF